MNEKQKVHFNEVVFIPAKRHFKGEFPYWAVIGKLKGFSGKDTSEVDIVIINCETSEEIPETFDKEISLIEKRIKESEKDEFALKFRKSHFENLRNKIKEGSEYRKDVPPEILDYLHKGNFSFIKANQIIFISGISCTSC